MSGEPYTTPKPIFWRTEPAPRFSMRQASLFALLVLLLLLWVADRARLVPLLLSPEQLQALTEMTHEKKRDLMFRFTDAPPEQENPEAEFFSDADRQRRSPQIQPEPPENNDPTSIGNSMELEQAQPEVSQLQEPAPERPEIRDVAPEEPEPVTMEEADDAGDMEAMTLMEGGPQPYRKLTKEELKDARKAALEELLKSEQMTARPPSQAPPSRAQYHNPGGAMAPLLGLTVDTQGHELGPYLKQLVQLVRGNWRVPEIARYEVSGVSVVSFRIHQDGRIENTTVIHSSGHEPLDVSSYNAVNLVHKAPPLPQHIQEPFINIRFAFYYNMRPPY